MNSFIRNIYIKYANLIKSSSPERLLKIISAIEYVEAIFEITATKLFGEKFKWLIIVLTQLTKCLLRLCLLMIHKMGIQPSVQLFTLKTFLSAKKDQNNNDSQINSQIFESDQVAASTSRAYRLKHTNRIIRSIHNSPDLNSRDWKLNEKDLTEANEIKNDFNPKQDFQHLFAEILYITRPICHLSCLYYFKSDSWVQFIVPFLMDSSSLLLMSDVRTFSRKQKKEMRRRAILFFHYFMRSPLYEIFSKSIISVGLNMCEQNIPLGRYIAKPIDNYIPQWRSVYNYCWSA